MTEEQKEKAKDVKRINQRMADIRKRFGEDSSLYRNYANAIILAIPDDAILPSGNISHSNAALDMISDKDLNALLRKETAGDIIYKAKEEAKREQEETGESVSWQDVISAQESVYQLIEDDYDDFYEAVDFYWDTIGGKGHPRPTYMEIRGINRSQNEQKQAIEMGLPNAAKEMRRNIEDKLHKRLEAHDAQARYFS